MRIELNAKRMPLEEDLTVLIDYEQYQRRAEPKRIRRHVNQPLWPNPVPLSLPYPFQQSFQAGTHNKPYNSDECKDNNGITEQIYTKMLWRN